MSIKINELLLLHICTQFSPLVRSSGSRSCHGYSGPTNLFCSLFSHHTKLSSHFSSLAFTYMLMRNSYPTIKHHLMTQQFKLAVVLLDPLKLTCCPFLILRKVISTSTDSSSFCNKHSLHRQKFSEY